MTHNFWNLLKQSTILRTGRRPVMRPQKWSAFYQKKRDNWFNWFAVLSSVLSNILSAITAIGCFPVFMTVLSVRHISSQRCKSRSSRQDLHTRVPILSMIYSKVSNVFMTVQWRDPLKVGKHLRPHSIVWPTPVFVSTFSAQECNNSHVFEYLNLQIVN